MVVIVLHSALMILNNLNVEVWDKKRDCLNRQPLKRCGVILSLSNH